MEKLIAIRKSKGLTQEYMTDKLGYYSISTYSKIERGIIKITLNKAKEICKILNCKLEDIVE